jgi:hypothetical protein
VLAPEALRVADDPEQMVCGFTVTEGTEFTSTVAVVFAEQLPELPVTV